MSHPHWSPAWQQKDVEIKENNLVYSGFYKLRQLNLRHRCFSGEWSEWVTREQIRRADAAAVLLWDPKQDKIVLIEQCRMALIGVYKNQSPWLLEIVAGLCDPGETPEETIRRESKEEAGYELIELIPIGEFYNSPGGFAEKTYLFCGIIQAKDTGEIHGLPQDHEDIKTHVLDAAQILKDLETGKLVTSASTLIALQWLREKRKEKVNL